VLSLLLFGTCLCIGKEWKGKVGRHMVGFLR